MARAEGLFLAPLLLLSCFGFAVGAEENFVLTGEVHLGEEGRLRRQRALVTLRGAHDPFFARRWSSLGGRFRFEKLAAGVYVLSAEIRGLATSHISIDISPSLADEKGRIHRIIRLEKGSAGASGRVSVAQLSISRKAFQAFARAEELLGKGKVDEAVRRLEKILKKEPRFPHALNMLGTIAYQREEFSRAEAYFQQALEADPSAYAPLVNLGGALLSLGRFDEALETNRRALQERPEDPLANSQLGLSYWGLGETVDAIQYLNRARELDPGHFSFPQLSLARIYLSRDDASRARQQLEEFLRLHPDSSEASQVRTLLEKLAKSSPP